MTAGAGGGRASGDAGASRPGRSLPADRASWPAEARDFFEERAGLVEYLAKRTRAQAELEAEGMTRRWWASSW